MNMIPVQSSNVAAVGYDPSRRVLRVRFTSGSTYDYGKVDAYLHEGLTQAESVGRYLQRNIIPFHPVSKVAEDREEDV